MTSTASEDAARKALRLQGHSPWVWALRRAVLGLFIMTVVIAGFAWLLHSAIESEAVASAGAGGKTPLSTAAPAAPIPTDASIGLVLSPAER